ncbi:flagellar FlbD family protein [Gemmatimonas aurantiaca]|nr:flagellar FlbD family protein [Gemmatimonas aurantiaca]
MMIKLTKLNRDQLFVNVDLIEFVESIPDTVISMTTGRKAFVRESLEETLELIESSKCQRQNITAQSSVPGEFALSGAESVTSEV